MSQEEEVKLLREILEELKALRAILANEYHRGWDVYIEEHIRRLDAKTLQKHPLQENINIRENRRKDFSKRRQILK
jgi:hypothetical protein